MTGAAVLSVNVSSRRVVVWREQRIETGFYKEPVDRPVDLRGVNLVGDDQADRAVHGGTFKSVYAYPQEHYAFWEDWLDTELPPSGAFGENLTVGGLLEKDVACGDVLHIGSASLIVTEPRVPCWKLGMRHGRDDLPGAFAKAARTGWYMSVQRDGALQSGDEIRIERAVGPRVTMSQLAAVRSDPSGFDVDLIQTARDLTWITDEWRAFLDRIVHRRHNRVPPADLQPLRLRVAGRRMLSEDVVELTLARATTEPLPTSQAGQFVALTLPGRDGRPRTRCYSLCGEPAAETWTVAVKRVDGTDPTTPLISHQFHGLGTGDELEAVAPAGSFTLGRHSPGRPVVLIGGGIGVTPIIAMLRLLLADEVTPDDPVVVVHACHSATRELYADVFSQAHARDGVTVHTFCASGEATTAGQQHDGFIDTDRLLALIPSLPSDVFVCGPPGLTRSLREGLAARGFPMEDFHTEAFGPAAARATPVDRSGPCEVTFDRSSYTVLSTDVSETILDIAERHGVTLPSSCRSGSCGTCVTGLLDGAVAYPTVPTAPHTAGQVVACLAIPTTGVVIDA